MYLYIYILNFAFPWALQPLPNLPYSVGILPPKTPKLEDCRPRAPQRKSILHTGQRTATHRAAKHGQSTKDNNYFKALNRDSVVVEICQGKRQPGASNGCPGNGSIARTGKSPGCSTGVCEISAIRDPANS